MGSGSGGSGGGNGGWASGARSAVPRWTIAAYCSPGEAQGRPGARKAPPNGSHLGHEPHGGPRRFDARRQPSKTRSRCSYDPGLLGDAARRAPRSWRRLQGSPPTQQRSWCVDCGSTACRANKPAGQPAAPCRISCTAGGERKRSPAGRLAARDIAQSRQTQRSRLCSGRMVQATHAPSAAAGEPNARAACDLWGVTSFWINPHPLPAACRLPPCALPRAAAAPPAALRCGRRCRGEWRSPQPQRGHTAGAGQQLQGGSLLHCSCPCNDGRARETLVPTWLTWLGLMVRTHRALCRTMPAWWSSCSSAACMLRWRRSAG